MVIGMGFQEFRAGSPGLRGLASLQSFTLIVIHVALLSTVIVVVEIITVLGGKLRVVVSITSRAIVIVSTSES